MKQNSQTDEREKCLLNIEDLIDPRIRENKIYNNCLDSLLEENYNPENPDLNLYIKERCVSLDIEYENATLLFREKNGNPYINDKTKEVKNKPIEYKRLNVSLSDSVKLANIYTEKFNEKQRNDRIKELQGFTKTPNLDLFNQSMEELKTIYDFTGKDIMYITHWITNVKRTILNMNVELPQILCFTSHKQNIGKSFLASAIAKVINKRIITTDLIKLSARFQPLTLTTESVLWIDELKKIDKTISDNIKTLITTDTVDFEFKGKNGYRQYRKLANFIMSINYDPSNIFYEDHQQRRIAVINFNGYTQKKTRTELESLIQNIWNDSPIEYIIEPDTIAEMTFNEPKENSVLEYFICEGIYKLFDGGKYYTASKIIANLFNYNGNRNKVITFLKCEEYFIQNKKTNGILLFKPTEKFKSILNEIKEISEEDMDQFIYEFQRKVS
jgi:hypothetical protein